MTESNGSEPFQLPDSYVHLQESAVIPTDEDLLLLRSTRQEKEGRRKALQDEVDGMLRVLDERRQEIQELDKEIGAYSYLASPLRRTPPHILRDIFSYSIPYTVIGVRDITLFAPWTLLRVCKHWRNVCLMYGSLWSDIHIDADEDHGSVLERPVLRPADAPVHIDIDEWETPDEGFFPDPWKAVSRAAELLELKLQRSRSADLTITISPRMRQNYAQPFLRILLPHLHRCAYLSAPFHIIGHTPFASRLKTLRHVVVDYTCSDYAMMQFNPGPPIATDIGITEEEAETLNAIASMTLDTFSAILNTYRGTKPVVHQPQRLTSLAVFNVRPRETAITSELLPQLKNIRELQLSGSPERLNPTGSAAAAATAEFARQVFPRTLLDKLTSLKVSGKTLSMQVLRSIEAPSLTSLDCPTPFEPGAVQEFLDASACQLRVLILDTSVDLDALPGILRASTASWQLLETLRFRQTFSRAPHGKIAAASSALLDLLMRPSEETETPDGGPDADLFPQLTHLDLGSLRCSLDQVIDLLESRRTQAPGNHQTQLISCKLTNVVSLQRRFTETQSNKTNDEQQVRGLLRKEAALESPAPGPDAFSESRRLLHNAVGMRTSSAWRRRADWHRSIGAPYVPHLTWVEALEKEKEKGQMAQRLDRLQGEGLEVWLRAMRWNEEGDSLGRGFYYSTSLVLDDLF